MSAIEFALLLVAWGLAGASPGPATLTIAGTAMSAGRRAGVLTGAGVLAGSLFWGVAAMMGMSALMLTHGWTVEVMRYLGAGYLLFLAVKSLRAGLTAKPGLEARTEAPRHPFRKGLLVHLTNPKAILSWGAIFAVVVPPDAPVGDLISVLAALSMVSALVFLGYGVLFSGPGVMRAYSAARRWIELAFGLLFGAAGLKILTARLT